MSKRYLVTGGSGFLGAALVRRLLRAGHHVRVLDDNSRGRLRRLDEVVDEIDFIEGDVRRAESVDAAVKGVDAVVHLAAINGTEFFYSRPREVLDVALRGMLTVMDACSRFEVGDLVVMSSSEVYQSPPVVPTPETVPLVVPDVLNPRYSYGGGKLASELIAINYSRSGFRRVAIVRPHNVYGPDMGWEHVIPQFALRAAAAAAAAPDARCIDFEILGDGAQTRAFVHVDDFTEGLMAVVERGVHHGIYHVGNREEVTVADLARRVVECLGREANIIQRDAPAGETRRRCPDIDRVTELGYRPSVTLAEGLPGVVDWYLRNGHLQHVSSEESR